MEDRFFTVTNNGVLLRVRARPGAREDAVLGVRGAELKVTVRAAAEKGKANGDIARILSRALGIARNEVVLRSGAASRRKVFHLPSTAAPALERMETGR